MKIRSRIALLTVSALLFSCSSARKIDDSYEVPRAGETGGTETIAILGTNDLHGSIAIDHLKTRDANPVDYEAGGLPTLAAYIRVLKSEFGPRLLWLDGGDEFQGSIESNLEHGKTLVSFFNQMGLDGAAIGNHEFDYGPETPGSPDLLGALKARMSEARYSYLAANIVDRATGQLAAFPNTVPSKLYTVGKLRVGVIGLSTLDTPKTTRAINVRTLEFADLKDATLREAQALRKQGADLVLVTSHVGIGCAPGRVTTALTLRKPSDPQGECNPDDEMVRLLRSLPGGTVDAVVAGHSHQIVHHWVSGVPVIQGGSLGRYFNVIYLTYDFQAKKLLADRTRIEGPVPVCPKVFQNQGDCAGDRPVPKNGRGALVKARYHGHAIRPDSDVESLIQPAVARAAELKKQVIGMAARPVEAERYKESPLGNLVADAVRESVHADVSLMNAGGIRAPLEQGPITYGGVFRVLPFDNAIVKMKVTGKELLQILRVGESGSRGFCSISGARLRLIGAEYDAPSTDLNGDKKIEPWEINRIIEARLEDGTKIEDKKTYTLATIDFLATGGDDVGWALQKIPAERVEYSNILLRDAAVDHIRKLSSGGAQVNAADHPLVSAEEPRLKFEKPAKASRKKRRSRKKRAKRA